MGVPQKSGTRDSLIIITWRSQRWGNFVDATHHHFALCYEDFGNDNGEWERRPGDNMVRSAGNIIRLLYLYLVSKGLVVNKEAGYNAVSGTAFRALPKWIWKTNL